MFADETERSKIFQLLLHAFRQTKPFLKGRRLELYHSKYMIVINSISFNIRSLNYTEAMHVMKTYVYFIDCLDQKSLDQIMDNPDDTSYWVHSFAYYMKHYVVGRKKPWTMRDVVNEVFIEDQLTSRKWDVHGMRNTGRY